MSPTSRAAISRPRSCSIAGEPIVATLVDVARTVDPKLRVPWYGPAMGARSFITARLMETWAHGQDVVDALHAHREPTDRLRHVAHIGVGARPFSYVANGREPNEAPVRVELVGPSR